VLDGWRSDLAESVASLKFETIGDRCEEDKKLAKETTLVPSGRNVQSGDAFEDTAFKPGFEIVKFNTVPGCRVSALLFFVE
jgi:hypothetical protein